MKIYQLLAALCAGILIVSSCENQEETISANTSCKPMEYLDVTYNGKTYENVPTKTDENGEFVFMDSEFSKIYANELANNDEWSIYMNDVSSISFYSSLKENVNINKIEKINGEPEINIPSSRALPNWGLENTVIVCLYKNKEFGTTLETYNLQESPVYIPGVPSSHNDECSSIKMANNCPVSGGKTIYLDGILRSVSDLDGVFIGYEHKNYEGRSVVIALPPSKTFDMPYVPKWFNDKLTSLQLFFANKGQYQTTVE